MLIEVMSGPLRDFALSPLRTRPRQLRAIHSVERILTAAAEISLRTPSEPICLEAIATLARVTSQAAYRYFRNADGVVDTALRCLVVQEHERTIAMLSGHTLPDVQALTRAVIDVVLDGRDAVRRLPAPIYGRALSIYRDLGMEASSVIAELICSSAKDGDVRRSIDVGRFAWALVALYAVSGVRNGADPFPPREHIACLLATVFAGVLRDQR